MSKSKPGTSEQTPSIDAHSTSTGQWLFDLGNTRLKMAPLQADGRPGPIQAFAHDDQAMDSIELPSGEVAHVASVAGDRGMQLLQRLTHAFGRIHVARTQRSWNGLRIAYAMPSRLGVDRFLAMAAARHRDPGAQLLVAVGTALTIDLVDADGLHRGGRIAPSPALMRTSLHMRAAQLPEEGGAFVEFATDTRDALASGCEGAALALIERSLTQAQALLNETPRLLLHGGGAPALQRLMHQSAQMQALLVEGLVLEGLALWALGD